LVQK